MERRLRAYGAAIQTIEEGKVGKARYFLMTLIPAEGRVTVRGFGLGQLEFATREYLNVERAIEPLPGAEAVLVSVDSIAALQRAFQTTFLIRARFSRRCSGRWLDSVMTETPNNRIEQTVASATLACESLATQCRGGSSCGAVRRRGDSRTGGYSATGRCGSPARRSIRCDRGRGVQPGSRARHPPSPWADRHSHA